jgi:hypothetical protein
MRPKLLNAPDPYKALAALPDLSGASFLAVLRDIPGRLVCEIRLEGQPAYLKQFRLGDPAAAVRRTVARLDEAARILGQDRDAVALPLLVLPEHGIIITEAAAGQPLSRLLASASTSRRAAMIGRAGQWLAKLCHDSREDGTFGPFFWIGALDQRIAATKGDWIDGDLVASHMGLMRAEAEPLRGAPVARAAIHGDLTPDNLFLDPACNRMTGIDIQDRHTAPVARDMARLLVWLESRRRWPARRRIDGITAADHAALIAAPGLMGADQLAILRFMIGAIALEAYLDSARQPRRRRALMRCLKDWAIRA